ncbi:hypothetical protein CDIK_0032 [Cucumispora dikerogammari]|nr:hypothetical protein CDIK_0032 [Cucumispora dikerogammari]
MLIEKTYLRITTLFVSYISNTQQFYNNDRLYLNFRLSHGDQITSNNVNDLSNDINLYEMKLTDWKMESKKSGNSILLPLHNIQTISRVPVGTDLLLYSDFNRVTVENGILAGVHSYETEYRIYKNNKIIDTVSNTGSLFMYKNSCTDLLHLFILITYPGHDEFHYEKEKRLFLGQQHIDYIQFRNSEQEMGAKYIFYATDEKTTEEYALEIPSRSADYFFFYSFINVKDPASLNNESATLRVHGKNKKDSILEYCHQKNQILRENKDKEQEKLTNKALRDDLLSTPGRVINYTSDDSSCCIQ